MDFPSRDLSSSKSLEVPGDFLQSIFVLELLAPSRPLWIVSPWISDVEVIDNRGGRFAALNPSWPNGPIRLLSVLEAVVDRGGSVMLIANDSRHNDDFERRVKELGRESVRFLRDEDVHSKGIVGNQFSLDGSMNLTFSGVNRNDEHLIYRTDPEDIAERRLELDQRWGHTP